MSNYKLMKNGIMTNEDVFLQKDSIIGIIFYEKDEYIGVMTKEIYSEEGDSNSQEYSINSNSREDFNRIVEWINE